MQRYNKEFRDDVLGFLLRYPLQIGTKGEWGYGHVSVAA